MKCTIQKRELFLYHLQQKGVENSPKYMQTAIRCHVLQTFFSCNCRLCWTLVHSLVFFFLLFRPSCSVPLSLCIRRWSCSRRRWFSGTKQFLSARSEVFLLFLHIFHCNPVACYSLISLPVLYSDPSESWRQYSCLIWRICWSSRGSCVCEVHQHNILPTFLSVICSFCPILIVSFLRVRIKVSWLGDWFFFLQGLC